MTVKVALARAMRALADPVQGAWPGSPGGTGSGRTAPWSPRTALPCHPSLRGLASVPRV